MNFNVVGVGEVLWDMLLTGPQLGGTPANFAYHAHALGATARSSPASEMTILAERSSAGSTEWDCPQLLCKWMTLQRREQPRSVLAAMPTTVSTTR